MPVVSVSSEMRCRHSPVNSQCALSPVGAATPWSTRTLPVPAGGQVERRLELLLQGNSPKCPKGLFLLGKILLLPPYKERPVLSHSPPLQLDQGLSRSGSHAAQLSTLPSCPPPASMGLPLHPYSPPCDFKQPGLSWCCSSLVLQGRGPLARLSPRSLAAGPAGAGLHWSQGHFCPEAIPLPSVFSVSSILFGLLSS